MRVLSCLTDNRIGGPQIRALSVARSLRKRGIETVFWFPRGNGEFEQRLIEEGFCVYTAPCPRLHPPRNIGKNLQHALAFPAMIQQIRRCIVDADIDIVHANMSFNFQSVIAGSLGNCSVIWHLNDVNTPYPIDRVVSRLARQLADTIVVSSNPVHEYYFSNDEIETETIYPMVDTTVFDPDRSFDEAPSLYTELDIDESIPIVGSVGNINPIKGYEYFLRSVRDVVDSYGPINVPIVGEPVRTQQKHYRFLKDLRTKLGLEDTVYFLGRRSDIPKLISDFDVFVMPSVTETGPMTLMEAMAMEKPVVTTEVGVVSEQLIDKKHGRVVPPGNTERLTDAIRDALLTPEAHENWGKAARKRAESVFSLESAVNRHEDVYRETLYR